MNTPMQPQDDDIEALLGEDTALIQRYRALPAVEPGKQLDAAILGRAAGAVRRPAPRTRWLIPLASAASVVMAAGIGWRVHLAQQQDQTTAASSARDYEVLEIDLHEGDRRRDLGAAELPQSPAPASAPDDVAAKANPRPSLSEIIEGPARDNGVVVDEPHTRIDHAQLGRMPEQSQPMSDAYGSGSGISSQPQVAPAPAPAAEQRASASAEFERSKRVQRDRDASIDDESADGAAISSTETRRESQIARRGEPVYAPADWIEQIRNLVRGRRMPEARAEIRRFRAAYPSYRLPPDLRRYER